jgi:hypothetical protein
MVEIHQVPAENGKNKRQALGLMKWSTVIAEDE